ncbi:MAG TPA: hypothetical protein VGP82_25430 [Ktedonobacterales bacterium]|jgi:hypothetical protein|nr:hypothetical protein [Ktedonobacterales bacterium]
MASVADLVEPEIVRHLEIVRQLAGPTKVAQGSADVDAGRVRLTQFGPLVVATEVRADGTEAPEAVGLRSTPLGLQWSCTCVDGHGQTLCHRAVITALVTWQKAPKRRI